MPMKFYLLLFTACLSLLFSFLVAQAAAPDVSVAIDDGGNPVVIPGNPITPPDLSAQVAVFLGGLVVAHPWIALVLAFMGSMRFWAKPASLALHKYVASTASTADDQLLERVERSVWYTAFWFVVDWLTSIKLPARASTPARTEEVRHAAPGTLLAAAFCLTVASLAGGCAGTPEGRAFQTIASVQATVKTGLDAWSDHVVARKAQIAKLPAEEQLGPKSDLLKQEGKVVAALERYKEAAAAAEKGVYAALDAGQAPASAAMVAAAAEFSSVVELLLR